MSAIIWVLLVAVVFVCFYAFDDLDRYVARLQDDDERRER